jgi:ankyrin repeat protein
LQKASHCGHEQIVQLLLDRGADTKCQGGEYGNALQTAAARGHEGTVQILLNEGADPNMKGDLHSNALLAASTSGLHRIVQVLLEAGADANATIDSVSTKKNHADINGKIREICRWFPDPAGIYGTALQAASAGGYDEVVRVLPERC